VEAIVDNVQAIVQSETMSKQYIEQTGFHGHWRNKVQKSAWV